ncbi:T9SS type B sorting domain-containing protein [Flavobacterium sp.]|jgi:gliding motility-associated-like protein|uniref:T9SS type B sorting domain-containing protein n=1 Tax=Flavobacterium sp. TaxID=239 RepID=UPI0037BF29C1
MLVSQAQGEANIWYFGQNAGIDFNSGSPVALTNGQLVTDEGCATISNSSGQLLFYTDGITVYNRNHSIMVNGSGLMGHPSSTQSATIVPMPSSNNLYYIFTTDNEHDPNGFRYSIVDMNLDSGNGAVTTNKNVLVYTPTIENLGITKHGNGQDYWIVTHGWNSNSFIAYQLTASGLNLIPVVTNIGQVITGNPTDYVAAGTIKISPSGSKLAFTSVSDIAQLFNFDNSTGILSNGITLTTEGGDLYGAAFSPDESLLYISNTFGTIHQFNLNTTNIPNSEFTIYNGDILGQMQVGPDNKIYVAFGSSFYLGVINNPNLYGASCNFQRNGFYLDGKKSKLGLPSFSQSFFFIPAIQLNNACENQNTTFQFSTNQTVTSANWNFGDGSTSSALQPNHAYTNAGNYTVSVTIVTPYGTGSNTRNITIYPQPTLLNNTISLKQCDDNNDGFSAFNLNESIPLLVSNPTGLTFTFYETLTEAQSGTNQITNPTAYSNQIVSNDIIFVRVENSNGCYKTAQINLQVSTTLIPISFQLVYNECDDILSGTNTDGITTFDFSNATVQIQALYPTGQLLDITYYKNLSDALSETNKITNITNYSNIGYPNTQNIYVRVDSQINNECLGLGHHITLNVDRIPIVQPQILRHCDDDQDGIFAFDTTNLQTNLLNSLTNVVVTYSDQNGNPITMTNPFVSTSQTINVKVKNTFGKLCEYNSTIQFIVDDLPQAYTIPTTLTTVCDDETNPALQNGSYPFDTSTFQSTILGSQTGMIVNYYDTNNNPLPSPLPNPFNTTQQNILVEVINTNNNLCKATMTIPLIINSVPNINLIGNELICSDNPNFTKVINAGLVDTTTINNYTFTWFLNNDLIANQNQYWLTINIEGIYTVEVKNAQGCSRTRTITVTASNLAIIDSVVVHDLVDENSIMVLLSTTSLGDYVYSLDNINYQVSNVFSNIMPGIYSVYIKDLKGCGITQKEVSVLGIPKYFTPNGDGYNDYWNIDGVNQNFHSKSTIQIFDRYGKLLKQFNSLGHGWDGNYNNQPMPSEDYWFTINLEDGRNIKGHFTLKR